MKKPSKNLHKLNYSDGFALVEMIIVVLILVTTLTLIGISTGALNRYKLNTAAALMAQDIRLAQQLNMNQDGLYTIVFDIQNERYFLTRYTKTQKKVNLPYGIDLVGTNFDFDNNSYNGYDNKLCFNSKGEPIRQNSGYLFGGHVTLKDQNGNYLYVIVASITGRVRIGTSPPS